MAKKATKRASKGNPLWATPTQSDAIDKKYRAEDDLRTLERAKEIERDKERVRMVKALAKEKINSMQKIC